MTSRPASRIGRVCAWILVGTEIFIRSNASWMVVSRLSSANDVIVAGDERIVFEGTKKLLIRVQNNAKSAKQCQITGNRLEADHAAQSSPCCTLHRYGS